MFLAVFFIWNLNVCIFFQVVYVDGLCIAWVCIENERYHIVAFGYAVGLVVPLLAIYCFCSGYSVARPFARCREVFARHVFPCPKVHAFPSHIVNIYVYCDVVRSECLRLWNFVCACCYSWACEQSHFQCGCAHRNVYLRAACCFTALCSWFGSVGGVDKLCALLVAYGCKASLLHVVVMSWRQVYPCYVAAVAEQVAIVIATQYFG